MRLFGFDLNVAPIVCEDISSSKTIHVSNGLPDADVVNERALCEPIGVSQPGPSQHNNVDFPVECSQMVNAAGFHVGGYFEMGLDPFNLMPIIEKL